MLWNSRSALLRFRSKLEAITATQWSGFLKFEYHCLVIFDFLISSSDFRQCLRNDDITTFLDILEYSFLGPWDTHRINWINYGLWSVSRSCWTSRVEFVIWKKYDIVITYALMKISDKMRQSFYEYSTLVSVLLSKFPELSSLVAFSIANKPIGLFKISKFHLWILW